MWILTSVPPVGSRPLRIKHAINMHKLACPLVVSVLMLYWRNRGIHCYCYLATHGSYGLAWLIKDATFPDRSWEAPASVSSFFALFTLMALFWIAPYLVVTSAPPSAEVLFVCLVLYIFGFFFLHVGDAQKFFTLRLKSGLISDGLFSRTRNPNYFGELLIYSAFAAFAVSSEWWYLPWLVNVLVWTVLFVPNWIAKDHSLSRHPGWAAYKARSGMVIPWVFGDHCSASTPCAWCCSGTVLPQIPDGVSLDMTIIIHDDDGGKAGDGEDDDVDGNGIEFKKSAAKKNESTAGIQANRNTPKKKGQAKKRKDTDGNRMDFRRRNDSAGATMN